MERKLLAGAVGAGVGVRRCHVDDVAEPVAEHALGDGRPEMGSQAPVHGLDIRLRVTVEGKSTHQQDAAAPDQIARASGQLVGDRRKREIRARDFLHGHAAAAHLAQGFVDCVQVARAEVVGDIVGATREVAGLPRLRSGDDFPMDGNHGPLRVNLWVQSGLASGHYGPRARTSQAYGRSWRGIDRARSRP